MEIDKAPAGVAPLAANPMLLVFLDLSIEEIDILCGIDRSRELAGRPEGGWLDCLRASLKDCGSRRFLQEVRAASSPTG